MIKDILEKIFIALKNSESIAAYCQEKFAKNHFVVFGQNIEKPVTKEKAPAIVIAGIEDSARDYAKSIYKTTIGVMVAEEKTEEDSKGLKYLGFIEVEELREKVEDVLFSLPMKMGIESQSIQAELFPVFAARMTIIVEKMRSIKR